MRLAAKTAGSQVEAVKEAAQIRATMNAFAQLLADGLNAAAEGLDIATANSSESTFQC